MWLIFISEDTSTYFIQPIYFAIVIHDLCIPSVLSLCDEHMDMICILYVRITYSSIQIPMLSYTYICVSIYIYEYIYMTTTAQSKCANNVFSMITGL